MKKEKPVAIITGGSGYVGQAIAKALIAKGWLPILASRKPTSLKGAEGISCDLTDEKSIHELVKKVVKAHGTIGACIHAAAPATIRKALTETTLEEIDNEFAVTVRSAYALTRTAVPHMSAGAAFIGITTHSLETTEKIERNIGAYLPAKQALRALLRTLSHELEAKKIRVYAVAPKFMPGGLNAKLPAPVQKLLSRQDNGSSLSADDVAKVVATICTDASAFPSGTSIAIPSRVVSPL